MVYNKILLHNISCHLSLDFSLTEHRFSSFFFFIIWKNLQYKIKDYQTRGQSLLQQLRWEMLAIARLAWRQDPEQEWVSSTCREEGRLDLLKVGLQDNPVNRIAGLGDDEQWNNWEFNTLRNILNVVKWLDLGRFWNVIWPLSVTLFLTSIIIYEQFCL